MSVFRLARFELRRMTRGRLPRAALAVLTVIPLLYGALYLYAFWDPYGNMDRIPVALVNADRPAKTADGGEVHAGQDLTRRLLDRKVFGWTVTDARDATAGLSSGRYHLVFSIPEDFSATLAANPEPDHPARPAELTVVNDDATNYLSGLLARSAFSEIRAAAAESASTGYFDRMLVGFTDLKAETGQAADGAGQLADGLTRSQDGADRLAGGLGDAEAGAGKLSAGLGQAAHGADQLSGGIDKLRTGAAQLADGSAQVATQTRAAAEKVDAAVGTVDTAAGTIEPVLRKNADSIARSATAIADGADALAAGLDALPRQADDAVAQARAVRDRLDTLVAKHPDLAADRDVTAARRAADNLVDTAGKMAGTLDRLDLAKLKKEMRQVAATARQVAAAAPHLADDVADARTKVHQLSDGLGRLADATGKVAKGNAELRDGLGGAADGVHQIRGALFRLSTGARDLDGGLAQLGGGGAQLAAGLTKLESGAGQLADGLAAGEQKIPGYADAADRAGILGDPVQLDRSSQHPAASYGVGFAPYFLALALWVGAMITYMLLRPVNQRHVMSGAPAWRVALAGWLPAAAIGLAQAGVLFTVVTLALGLDPVHPGATLGLLALTSLTFTAIMQWLGAQLGPAGRLAALALLMLQLTSSGGTYPVQTSPGFFQVIHPYLPMTYVVQGLRHTINGGPAATVVTGALVVTGFGVAALLLTVVAARRARRLTPARLHPELSM
ncbi:YhgE/Pip domain-containing protein [Micromonospora sp. KC721]|uniref:YhgE/Pip domain-containing protein n=1 Tax=Micromonospora sp. KC721 TaxID=2530380 RepID=UPI001050C24C|nr:YhgE/Pip domain-containing protein [Micromonospora sp. KC721]TDB80095.1 YhgE/Pip domain-containing protein [Micromonospora sp. KC721]